MNTAVNQFWTDFCDRNPQVDPNSAYQSWYFGNSPEMANELADLVLAGKKTATASLASVNEIEPDKAPILDGYSVVTDLAGDPVCVIQTTEIRHIPFNEVDAEFAFDEGEGDQSLDYWRGVHWDYFSREAMQHGIEFDETSIICCERFRLL